MSVSVIPHGDRNLYNNQYQPDPEFGRRDIDPDDVSLLTADTDDPVEVYDEIDTFDTEDDDRFYGASSLWLGESSEGDEPRRMHIDSNYPMFRSNLGNRSGIDVTRIKGNLDQRVLQNPLANTSTSSLDTSDDDYQYVPSDVVDYYNESVLKAKQRNALDDSQFGLPRQRAYPLNDENHVRQAIRMFHHCKEADRKTLANNIFKAVKRFNMDITIGDDNPLAPYAPKNLRENAALPKPPLFGFEKPMSKRTREDIIKEHERLNAHYHNDIFLGNDLVNSITNMDRFSFMKYFYPNLRTMNFAAYLHGCIGGIVFSDDADKIYSALGMRKPLDIKFGSPIGWKNIDDTSAEKIADLISSASYRKDKNWFKANLASDINHTLYCLRLYSIMGKILLDPTFDQEKDLLDEHRALLMDWEDKVEYHHALDEDSHSDKEAQYQFDLFWNNLDNPKSEDVKSTNIFSFVRAMRSVKDVGISINELGGMIYKEDFNEYKAKDLDKPDQLYLLPSKKKFLCMDQNTVQIAMEAFPGVPKEDQKEYAKNLNRLYVELGCDFSIPSNHPFVRYADTRYIPIENDKILQEEGDLAITDDGTSSNPPDHHPNLTEQPWYKRLDYVRGINTNLLDNKELGPNKTRDYIRNEPDYTDKEMFLDA